MCSCGAKNLSDVCGEDPVSEINSNLIPTLPIFPLVTSWFCVTKICVTLAC